MSTHFLINDILCWCFFCFWVVELKHRADVGLPVHSTLCADSFWSRSLDLNGLRWWPQLVVTENVGRIRQNLRCNISESGCNAHLHVDCKQVSHSSKCLDPGVTSWPRALLFVQSWLLCHSCIKGEGSSGDSGIMTIYCVVFMMTGTLIAWNMVMNNKMFSDVVPSVTWLTSLRCLNEKRGRIAVAKVTPPCFHIQFCNKEFKRFMDSNIPW